MIYCGTFKKVNSQRQKILCTGKNTGPVSFTCICLSFLFEFHFSNKCFCSEKLPLFNLTFKKVNYIFFWIFRKNVLNRFSLASTSLSFYLSYSNIHSLTQSHAFSHILAHSYTLSHILIHSPSLSHILTCSLPLSLSYLGADVLSIKMFGPKIFLAPKKVVCVHFCDEKQWP